MKVNQNLQKGKQATLFADDFIAIASNQIL